MKTTGLVDIRLEPNKGDRAQVMALGDLHLGAATADVSLFKKTVAHCVEKGIYVIGMGDMLDCALINSVSDVYEATSSPQEQFEEMISLLEPLAEKKLLIGLHFGNHEFRVAKATSFDVTAIM
jgi:UDP-2,3-diacylglucosamine pyrophosphatase LpxH